jgi:ABC-type multidrug transport system ATPase subunit
VALYLDEPTSGLDSTAALEVTEALKQIAHSTGITVAMVIHQPRFEIWAALDEVLFLAPGGRTVFLGNLADVEGYFARPGLGYMPSLRDNPADFYMDRIAEKGDQFVEQWKVYAADLEAQAEAMEKGGVGAGIGYGSHVLSRSKVSTTPSAHSESPLMAEAAAEKARRDSKDNDLGQGLLPGPSLTSLDAHGQDRGGGGDDGDGVFVPGLGADERVSRLSE